MSKFHIIGTGACGFLRLNFLLGDEIPLRYKGGRGKYQNSFENWSDNELIWDSENLSKDCLLYTSPSPRDRTRSRMPSSA